MSQLDISIAFSQLFGLLICLYFFYIFINNIINKYFYLEKYRNNEDINSIIYKGEKHDNVLPLIKKILII